MQTKHTIIIAAICCAATAATAQQSQQPRHEFSVNAGGGLSTLHYTPAAGSANAGFGGFAGLGYTFRFSERWGLGTGVEAALYNGKCALNPLSETYLRNDGEEDFSYTYTLTGYRDKQQAILLNIPLMLHFRTDIQLPNLAALQGFYAALGGKIGIPLRATFSSSAGKLNASGQYASGEFVLNKPKFMGFGEFSSLSNQGDLALKTAFFASAEVGVKWELSGKLSLSTGLYVDYGLSSIRPSAAAPLIDYAGSDDYRPTSALASTSVGKLNPIAAGIKVGLVFGAPSEKAAGAKVGVVFGVPSSTAPTAPDSTVREAEHRRKAAEEQRLAEARLLAEQKRAEEQRLSEERKADEARLYADAKRKIQQPADDYSLNGTALSAQQKADFDEKVALLQQFYPNAHIAVEGHTCSTGTHAVNLRIAQKRADAVKSYLLQKGIAASRITTLSKAETEPLAPNDSEANRRKNRRVAVVIRE